MTMQQRQYAVRRPAARAALRPARIALILEIEYRRAQRDLRHR